MHSALVVGGDGLIGRVLGPQLIASGCKVIGTTRHQEPALGQLRFDLAHGVQALPAETATQFQVVFICAAVTGFAACANDPEGSRYINVIRTVELGSHFMRQGALVVYLSSNSVFDGTRADLDEMATTSPASEYGRQKADCEKGLMTAAQDLTGACAIVRLTKVVDRSQGLYKGWIQCFQSHIPAKAAVDLMMCPVTTGYVVSGLQRIALEGQGGVFHLSGERDLTYFELASAMGFKADRSAVIERDWVQQRLGVVPAPAHGAMSMLHTTAACGLQPQALADVVQELTEQT